MSTSEIDPFDRKYNEEESSGEALPVSEVVDGRVIFLAQVATLAESMDKGKDSAMLIPSQPHMQVMLPGDAINRSKQVLNDSGLPRMEVNYYDKAQKGEI